MIAVLFFFCYECGGNFCYEQGRIYPPERTVVYNRAVSGLKDSISGEIGSAVWIFVLAVIWVICLLKTVRFQKQSGAGKAEAASEAFEDKLDSLRNDVLEGTAKKQYQGEWGF